MFLELLFVELNAIPRSWVFINMINWITVASMICQEVWANPFRRLLIDDHSSIDVSLGVIHKNFKQELFMLIFVCSPKIYLGFCVNAHNTSLFAFINPVGFYKTHIMSLFKSLSIEVMIWKRNVFVWFDELILIRSSDVHAFGQNNGCFWIPFLHFQSGRTS